MSSSFSDDQLQADDTLEDRGVDDVLDEGMSPPERPSHDLARGLTAAEDAAGETLDERIAQEEPDPVTDLDHSAQDQADELIDGDENADPTDGFEVGDERAGRLVADTDDADDLASEVGIDGGAASAEEAAMHVVQEDLP